MGIINLHLGYVFVFILLFSPSFKADKNEQLSKSKADDKMNIVMEVYFLFTTNCFNYVI